MTAEKNKPQSLQAVLFAWCLGVIAGGSLVIALLHRELWLVALYLGSLATFHFLEYYLQARYRPFDTDQDAFLLNHSQEYCLALIAGVAEAGTLARLSGYRMLAPVQTALGPLLLGLGLALRMGAMMTAKANFSHLVVHDFSCKDPDHELVTTGIYRFVRHPAYLGFWLFAVGGQVTLGSWCCASLYALVLHKFFRERIVVEEAALLHRYPSAYQKYREHTWSGLPFIR